MIKLTPSPAIQMLDISASHERMKVVSERTQRMGTFANGDGRQIRVAIVEDHPVLGETLARLIAREADCIVTGIAQNVLDAMSLISSTRPDVVLMDYRLPDGNGLQAATTVIRLWPLTKVLMLSGLSESSLQDRSIEAGCIGFIGKHQPGGDVIAAIRSTVADPNRVNTTEQAAPVRTIKGDHRPLTAREIEVLELIAAGKSTFGIASELFVSVNTVRNHVRSLLSKLQVHSKVEAVSFALRAKIIQPEAMGTPTPAEQALSATLR